MNKRRSEVSPEIAAKVLFLSDRTCCVCRVKGKPVQIYHVDGDTENNDIRNLAVLCLDCHNETLITGGFHRKITSEQIMLYREDWHSAVARERSSTQVLDETDEGTKSVQLRLVTDSIEVFQESGNHLALARLYDDIGNTELRDKHVEEALSKGVPDMEVLVARHLQNRPDLVPQEIIDRLISRMTEDENWTDLSWVHQILGDYRKAAELLVRAISEHLSESNYFTAAYYLRSAGRDGIIDALFEMALQKSVAEDNLFWQVRALEELGWDSELESLLLAKKDEIEESGDVELQSRLYRISRDWDAYVKMRKESLMSRYLGLDAEEDEGEEALEEDLA